MSIEKIKSLYKFSDNQIHDIKCLAGDASSRQYFRLVCENSHLIACLDQSINHDFLFMQKVLNDNEIKVPHILDVDEKSGFILQNDLGDQTLLNYLSLVYSIEDEYGIYKAVIDELIKIHRIDTKNISGNCVNLSFDVEKLMQEVRMTNKYFLKGYLKSKVKDSEINEINKAFEYLCGMLNVDEFLLVHRDFHSKNIMIHDSQTYVIDFQDARLGLPQYDLVSLLDDCYYKVTEVNVDKLKKYYWDTFLSKTNMQKDYTHYLYLYDLMAIQRIYKAIGSFAYIFIEKGNPLYLKHIGFAFEKLRDKLSKYPQFDSLTKVLTKRYYED